MSLPCLPCHCAVIYLSPLFFWLSAAWECGGRVCCGKFASHTHTHTQHTHCRRVGEGRPLGWHAMRGSLATNPYRSRSVYSAALGPNECVEGRRVNFNFSSTRFSLFHTRPCFVWLALLSTPRHTWGEVGAWALPPLGMFVLHYGHAIPSPTSLLPNDRHPFLLHHGHTHLITLLRPHAYPLFRSNSWSQ